MFRQRYQAITHIRGSHGDLNWYTPSRENLTTWRKRGLQDHTCGHSLQQRSKSRAKSHLSLVRVFHAIPHSGISTSGSYNIPIYIPAEEVRYYPTQRPLKLLSLRDPINPVYISIYSMLHRAQCDTVLNWHRFGLPPRSSKSDIRPHSPFPSSILHLPTLRFSSTL
jgi:hypothetical protein